jgi:hypothetical protein
MATVDEILALQEAESGPPPSTDDILKLQGPVEPEPYIPEPTLEETSGAKDLYSLVDKLKYLDKARSAAFSATAGPLFDIIQGKNPIPTMEKELITAEPQSESSFAGRFRGLFPGQKPIMSTPQEDVSSKTMLGLGRIEAAGKLWAQKEFPEAYGVVSNIVPSDIPGTLLDIETGKFTLPRIPQEGVVGALEEGASRGRRTGLLRASDLERSKNIEIVNNSKMKIVGDTLNKYGVADQISDPEKLHTTLAGESTTAYDPMGRQRSVQSPGLIDDLHGTVKQAADHLSMEIAPVDVNIMASDITNELRGQAAKKTSLVPFGDIEEANLAKDIRKKLKVDQGNTTATIGDLIDMKRNAADHIYAIKNNPATYGIQGVTDLKVNKAIWNWIDNTINEMATKDNNPNVKNFVLANSELSDLLNAKDMVAGAKTTSLSGASALEALGTAGIGLGVGSMVGHPVIGASIGGAFGAGRAVMKDISNQIPARAASLAQNAADFIRPGQGMAALSPVTTVGAMASAPPTVQNIPTTQQQLMMRKAFVENLAEFKIPRTVKEIFANKELVLAKIAQVTNNPKIVDGLRDSMNMEPDLFKNTLPALIMQFPQVFKPNRFPSWSNGKLLDPMDVQVALKELAARQGLSNTERMIINNGLLRDGSFPESF